MTERSTWTIGSAIGTANLTKRLLVGVLGMLAALFFAGCTRVVEPVKPEESDAQPIDSIVNALGTDVTPVPVYGKVYTPRRLVSIVLEGFADETNIRAMADQIRARGIPAVFFLSYVDVSDYPDAAQYIVSTGGEIGNYGLDGEKNMQTNTTEQNARAFSRTQAAVLAATGQTPAYLRCNGSEYTPEMLELASICGLKAAVQPNEYLNYRSFTSAMGARNYVRKIQRGSIISIKLGQELDSLEFKGSGTPLDEKPAIDKKPSISAEDLYDEDSLSENVLECLTHLLDALQDEGFVIVSLEDLQRADQAGEGIVHPLDEAERTLYNAESYTSLVTLEPLGEAETSAADDSYFDHAVFIGDSATMKLEAYINYQKQTDPAFFGTVNFLTNSSLGVGSALWQVGEKTAHPLYEGRAMSIEDAISNMGDIQRVYLMLGINDIGTYETEEYLDNYRTLLELIQKAAPEAEIFIESILPGAESRTTPPSNADIFRFNLALAGFAKERGYHYLDVASALRDSSGALSDIYCQDPANTGLRLNDSAAATWIAFLRTHAPGQLPPVEATDGVEQETASAE